MSLSVQALTHSLAHMPQRVVIHERDVIARRAAPHDVPDPLSVPSTVCNCAASRCASRRAGDSALLCATRGGGPSPRHCTCWCWCSARECSSSVVASTGHCRRRDDLACAFVPTAEHVCTQTRTQTHSRACQLVCVCVVQWILDDAPELLSSSHTTARGRWWRLPIQYPVCVRDVLTPVGFLPQSTLVSAATLAVASAGALLLVGVSLKTARSPTQLALNARGAAWQPATALSRVES